MDGELETHLDGLQDGTLAGGKRSKKMENVGQADVTTSLYD